MLDSTDSKEQQRQPRIELGGHESSRNQNKKAAGDVLSVEDRADIAYIGVLVETVAAWNSLGIYFKVIHFFRQWSGTYQTVESSLCSWRLYDSNGQGRESQNS